MKYRFVLPLLMLAFGCQKPEIKRYETPSFHITQVEQSNAIVRYVDVDSTGHGLDYVDLVNTNKQASRTVLPVDPEFGDFEKEYKELTKDVGVEK